MSLPGPGELDLFVRRLQGGDRSAFEGLVRAFEKPLFSYLARFVRDRQTAEDLFQEVFLRVHTDLDRFEPGSNFAAWLYRVAHNLAVDWLRHRQHEEPAGELSPAGAARVSSGEHDPAEARLALAVARLPEGQRAVVCLRAYGELPFREIARVLDEPLGTVLGRMRLATIALRRELDPAAKETKA